MAMTSKVVFVAVLLFVCCGWSTAQSPAPPLVKQCADELQSVTTCLSFARGKTDSPTKQCCDSVEGMRESNPACLCFVIQQIHNGSNSALKDMGLQVSRLLALPSSCKLENASISDCPRLLHLSPNSPDAAIFSSNSTNSASSAPDTGTASPSATTPHSNGFKLEVPQLAVPALAALSLFFFAFPSGQFTPTS